MLQQRDRILVALAGALSQPSSRMIVGVDAVPLSLTGFARFHADPLAAFSRGSPGR